MSCDRLLSRSNLLTCIRHQRQAIRSSMLADMRIVLCLLACSAAYAQVNRTIMVRGDEIMITFQRASQGLMRSVTGAAYSGDLVNQHTQTLADGTIITNPPGSQHNGRDRQGDPGPR